MYATLLLMPIFLVRLMIIIQNISKHFGGKVILEDFSYQFPSNANVALIGANGVGKTTFLNMICGLEEADAGQVIVPKGCTLAYLPQVPCEHPLPTILQECIAGHKDLCALQAARDQALQAMIADYSEVAFEAYERLEKAFMDKGGYALEADAKGILVGLGFETSQFDQSPLTLSGGWRMRVELAKLLINNPNFLILDEPTNHLDLPSLTWLEQYLRSFRGTLLFVSHDRDFLNNLSEVTLHMNKGNLRVYNGDFDAFLQQKAERAEQVRRERQALQRQQNHMQAFVDRFRYKATKAKQAQSRLKTIERLKQLEAKLDVEEEEKTVHFNMTVEKPSGRVVLTLDKAAIGYRAEGMAARESAPEKAEKGAQGLQGTQEVTSPAGALSGQPGASQEDVVLSRNLSLKILRGQKIAIVGANGIGKSTLLKSLVGEVPFLEGAPVWGAQVTLGYYAQDQRDTLDPEKTPLENLLALAPSVPQQQARALLGSLLITGDDLHKKTKVLSGGEKSKVALAALLAQRHNFLMLDEPTNHLDMSSVEVLGSALEAYNGTVLVVSHNRAFIKAFATHLFQMDRHNKAELIDVS